ncbi:hypothetical protein F52700_34 [Fusarium sp. NRRL 52700]|nr:hypothetical protein F52700_34 [Fusarium sp. NRRL 52700]
MAPNNNNNNNNNNNRPENPRCYSHPNVVLKTSTQLGLPFSYASERIGTIEEGIEKRLDKLEGFAININARAKNAREVFDKDTVVLHLRGLAHQVILSEVQSLNQATIAQIFAEVQATNARMDGRETRVVPKATKRPQNAIRKSQWQSGSGHYASNCPKKEE